MPSASPSSRQSRASITICSASTSGPGEAQRLGVELVELAVAALLRALVAEHRAREPDALRPLVDEVVLDRGAHDARRRLGPQRQALAVQPILERVHLLLDDVGGFADRAHEQRRGLDDRHAQVAVAVAAEHVARVFSKSSHSAASSGSTSFMPRTACSLPAGAVAAAAGPFGAIAAFVIRPP